MSIIRQEYQFVILDLKVETAVNSSVGLHAVTEFIGCATIQLCHCHCCHTICEVEGTTVAEVSQELLTKGRKLANQQGVELHAIVAGTGIKGQVEDQILPYGVDKLFVFDAEGLFPYTSAPHTDILVNLFKEEKPQIALMGATVIGRDLGPRVSSSLTSGLTADCTELEIGDYDDKKSGKHYEGLLYQIRPAFGGNIVATIVNPDHRPQMATVRSGVMQKSIYEGECKKEVANVSAPAKRRSVSNQPVSAPR